MNASDLIKRLSELPPETLVFVRYNLSYAAPVIRKIADTEYGIFPGSKKVVLISADQQFLC